METDSRSSLFVAAMLRWREMVRMKVTTLLMVLLVLHAALSSDN